MNDLEQRVVSCFQNVFPGLSADEIQRASTASLADWDSVAHVTLLSSIAEDFGVAFEMEDFEELVSFALIVDRLQTAAGNV